MTVHDAIIHGTTGSCVEGIDWMLIYVYTHIDAAMPKRWTDVSGCDSLEALSVWQPISPAFEFRSSCLCASTLVNQRDHINAPQMRRLFGVLGFNYE
jgi:hypothetical protein